MIDLDATTANAGAFDEDGQETDLYSLFMRRRNVGPEEHTASQASVADDEVVDENMLGHFAMAVVLTFGAAVFGIFMSAIMG
jgi:hypothetical protein